MALNTEFEKASSAQSSTEAEVNMVSEDRLVDELMKQKVQLLCKGFYQYVNCTTWLRKTLDRCYGSVHNAYRAASLPPSQQR